MDKIFRIQDSPTLKALQYIYIETEYGKYRGMCFGHSFEVHIDREDFWELIISGHENGTRQDGSCKNATFIHIIETIQMYELNENERTECYTGNKSVEELRF